VAHFPIVPELPEVETIRRQLRPHLRGARVVDAWSFPSAKFDDAPRAVGGRVTDVERRGKYLLIGLDLPDLTPEPAPVRTEEPDGRTAELIVHLGMTGRLSVGGESNEGHATIPSGRRAGVSADWPTATLHPPATDQHLRARWWFEDGRSLRFDDVRRFGRVAVVPAGDHRRLPTLDALGPEPFDDEFDPGHLRREVNRSRRALKTQLLGQRVVAGVGNIYADEALWTAGIHPASRRLTLAAAAHLHAALREVLTRGIENGGTTLRDYRDASGGAGHNQHHLECYGRAGAPCRRCGATLLHTVIDARSTTFCGTCQRRSR
jgi:formamidopyrimidine-DNA glycosylase